MTGFECSLNTCSLFLMVSSLSSDLPLVFPLLSSLLTNSCSSQSKKSTDFKSAHLAIIFSHTSMFYWPRGKPSNKYLPPKLFRSIFYWISLTISSLDTSWPWLIFASIYFPRGEADFTSSRKRSPVDKWRKPYFLTRTVHWLELEKLLRSLSRAWTA